MKIIRAIDIFYNFAKFAKPKPKSIIVRKYANGYVIIGNSFSPQVLDLVQKLCQNNIALLATDPPYGNIVSEDWDAITEEALCEKLIWLMQEMQKRMAKGTCAYVWGGIGKFKDRPFLKFLSTVEHQTDWFIKNLITWSKKRAYGTPSNYLFTREECAYLINGSEKPSVFHIPLLEKLRGYEGFNAKYKAKSEFLRRTNVWMDITELFSGKTHPTEKPAKLFEIPILAHTEEGEFVVDLFGGSGACAAAAINCGRKFVLVELNKKYAKVIDKRLGGFKREWMVEVKED